ncbi:metal-sensing transcriptional repressor [Dongia sp.]|uniref:metal-sensing transcriptional repressor n=1 Tax=Dongia sp. TaxID=1977262 RepID=UPI0037501EA8
MKRDEKTKSKQGEGHAASEGTVHRSHKQLINRLRRADGHLKKIIAMLEGGESCLSIAQQMQAVVSALDTAKTVLIHDHIDHCLEQVTGPIERSKRGPIDEFKEITKFL